VRRGHSATDPSHHDDGASAVSGAEARRCVRGFEDPNFPHARGRNPAERFETTHPRLVYVDRAFA